MDFTPVKRFMDHLAAARGPGCDISIRLRGQEVFRYQAGHEDAARTLPLGPDKLYNIYSCSKVATVAAALQLHEKGAFLLDTPVYEFIPEYRDITVRQPDGSAAPAKNIMTMRHLFTMTAGLNYDLFGPDMQQLQADTSGAVPTLALARALAARPLDFEPGARWQYSLCHDVLAAVVEAISGMTFRDYMQKNIFDVLGMDSTCYHNEAVLDRVALQYTYDLTETDPADLCAHISRGSLRQLDKTVPHILGTQHDSGGAGITTSVADYSLFISALANGGVGPNGGRILSPGSIRLLQTDQLTDAQRVDYNWPAMKGYGYGLGVRTMIAPALAGSVGSMGEFGWGGAAGANMLTDPATGLSVFFAQHCHFPQEEYYQPRLRNVVYGCLDI